MIKVKALEGFTLKRFAEIKMVERKNENDVDGHITKDDVFECPEDLAKYLTNEIENPAKKVLVEVIEIIPEQKEEVKTKKKTQIKKKK